MKGDLAVGLQIIRFSFEAIGVNAGIHHIVVLLANSLIRNEGFVRHEIGLAFWRIQHGPEILLPELLVFGVGIERSIHIR